MFCVCLDCDDGEELWVDVVPSDIFGPIEFDECLSAHVDRFDLTGESGESFEFGDRVVDLYELVGPFTLQQVDLIEERHSRYLLCGELLS